MLRVEPTNNNKTTMPFLSLLQEGPQIALKGKILGQGVMDSKVERSNSKIELIWDISKTTQLENQHARHKRSIKQLEIFPRF